MVVSVGWLGGSAFADDEASLGVKEGGGGGDEARPDPKNHRRRLQSASVALSPIRRALGVVSRTLQHQRLYVRY